MPRNYEADLRSLNPDTDLNPTFVALNGHDAPAALAEGLRRAFAFLRQHGNGRYSASSLMRLMDTADRCENTATNGGQLSPDDLPTVITADMPYTFDEETEVKTGGTLAVAVVLPDHRVLLAVNRNFRRQKLGTAMDAVARLAAPGQDFYNPGRNLTYWIHRSNLAGIQFATALEMQPWQMNRSDAVQFARYNPAEESDAVDEMNEYELNERLAMRGNNPRPRRRRGPSFYVDEAPAYVEPSRIEFATQYVPPTADPALERILAEEDEIERRQRRAAQLGEWMEEQVVANDF